MTLDFLDLFKYDQSILDTWLGFGMVGVRFCAVSVFGFYQILRTFTYPKFSILNLGKRIPRLRRERENTQNGHKFHPKRSSDGPGNGSQSWPFDQKNPSGRMVPSIRADFAKFYTWTEMTSGVGWLNLGLKFALLVVETDRNRDRVQVINSLNSLPISSLLSLSLAEIGSCGAWKIDLQAQVTSLLVLI